MWRTITCVGLFAVALFVMSGLSVGPRVWADDPGGNPALTWTDSGDTVGTKFDNQSCQYNGQCFGNQCYIWSHTHEGTTYKSFQKKELLLYGGCDPPPDNPTPPPTCKEYKTLACADVHMYLDTNYSLPPPKGLVLRVYIKDACKLGESSGGGN
jgi:hypothetical protein